MKAILLAAALTLVPALAQAAYVSGGYILRGYAGAVQADVCYPNNPPAGGRTC